MAQSEWKARDFRIAQYQKAIADIEKKSEHVEMYAPTLVALKKQLEALQGTFTLPALIAVEPPLEPLVFPNPETAPFSKIPEPAKKIVEVKIPEPPQGQLPTLEYAAHQDRGKPFWEL